MKIDEGNDSYQDSVESDNGVIGNTPLLKSGIIGSSPVCLLKNPMINIKECSRILYFLIIGILGSS